MMDTPYTWTPERIKRLIELDALGQSGSQIARDLGGVSRNAVIGKLHRLGITNVNRTAGRRIGHQLNKRAAAKPTAPKRLAAPRPQAVAASAGEPVVLQPLPASSLNLRICDPGFGGCKWPTAGEGAETRFCCVPTGGPTYCAAHAKKAYSTRPLTAATSADSLARMLRRYA